MIVDEEQRFGVEHKEHITALRTHVDVLTLSATPIPRTLEMSLAGIREMSTITTPPEDRHPTLTYVGAYDDKQVAAAIRRELLRDGQVFYVHNRVSTIDRAARQDPRARARGAGRRRARPDERGPARAHGQRVLAQRVRRAGLHHDRRERPGHLQREHADRRAQRHAGPLPAAPAARPGRPRPRARLRLLPLPARAPAHRDRARPARHHRPALRAGRGHGRRDEGPGDPRRGQHPGRRAERAHRRRRVRPLHPAGRRGRRRVPAGRRGAGGRRGGGAGRGAGGPAGRRARPARLRRRASGCGWRPTARSPRRPTRRRSTRSSRSSPTATASRRPPVRNLLAVAAFRQRCRAHGVAEVALAGANDPDRAGGPARLRAAAAAPAAPQGAVQGGGEAGHGAAPGRGWTDRRRRRCATWRCSTGAPL